MKDENQNLLDLCRLITLEDTIEKSTVVSKYGKELLLRTIAGKRQKFATNIEHAVITSNVRTIINP